jgi:hypothetical protein
MIHIDALIFFGLFILVSVVFYILGIRAGRQAERSIWMAREYLKARIAEQQGQSENIFSHPGADGGQGE